MKQFGYFAGVITMIDDYWLGNEQTTGCDKIITVENMSGEIVNFVATPTTYFVDNVTVMVGDPVIGFYDANAPVILIYPPQYRALVMARTSRFQQVKVDYFDSQLVSGDGSLKLNLSPYTRIMLENNQLFTGSPANRNLIVVYGPTTRSIPAQTTPYQIIVMCRHIDQ